MRGSLRSDTCFTKDEEEKAMACSAADLSGWTDFPKGLKVLLLDDDAISAAEMSSKLEGLGYIVTLFTNENEAIETISNRTENFHVAIVEVNTCSSQDKFRFLEMARGLPTVMISSANCLNTMMKCIALGAAEFLQRPLSDDKLRNIWQHVVHKAFNGVLGGTLPKSLEPVKETVASMLRMGSSDPASSEAAKENTANGTNSRKEDENLWTNDRLPAPSTPQLEQGSRVLDDGDCQDQVHCSMEHDDVDGETRNVNELSDGETLKDSTELMIFSGSESKLVDNASSNSVGGVDHHEPEMPLAPEEGPVKEEVNSSGGSESGEHLDVLKVSDVPPRSTDLKNESNASNPSKKSSTTPHRGSHSYSGGRSSKKKTKVDWTPELHRRFVQAVEQLGIDQAIPSKILELMRVEGLTRHNVASHLQKYRMHRRHVLPKCEERRWPHHRDSLSRVYAHRPFLPIPPTRSSFGYSACPVWGHPNYHPSSFPMGSQTWYPSHGSWPWKSYTRMYADAWGCPALSPQDPYSTLWTPQSLPQNRSLNHSRIPKNLFDLHLGEEVIDDVVKEAISKPWLPLPLGLKPPSTDSVLAELNRQGIRSIPPPKCNR